MHSEEELHSKAAWDTVFPGKTPAAGHRREKQEVELCVSVY